MADEQKPQSWWHTIPGVLTATAAVIMAVTGLVIALVQSGILGSNGGQPPTPRPDTLAGPPAAMDTAT